LTHGATPPERQRQRGALPPGAPMFESVLVFQNHPRAAADGDTAAGLKASGLGRLDKSTWPLMLVVEPGRQLRLEMIYDRHRIAGTIVLRILEQLATLLERVATDPKRTVGNLSLLAAAESHQALVEWNDTSTPFPEDVCYHDLFEAQAARTPDALAVACGADRVTYRELNERANRIARCLRDRGARCEARVAVCLDRSTDLVAARLAVLKAGAAYVPLDPSLPADRLRFMIADAGAEVVITEERLRDAVGTSTSAVFCVDGGRDEIHRHRGDNLNVRMSPANLAYVIYTSGSTGRPKGVATAHAGFVSLVTWHNAAYRVTAADRKSQLSGLGFDASVWELWPYLAAGASAHLPDERTRADWPRLLAWLRAEKITVSFFPTPLAEAVIEQPWPADLELRALLTGGDRLHAWPRQRLPFAFVNKYGPTEVTAVTTWAPLIAGGQRRPDPPTIGRPIANLQLYVLSERLQPLPAGAAGELYIGGIGLARGYVGRPDLTADRFVPNPFAAVPGSRLYRTGDLVRWSRDGEIDFLGRVDAQMKIRGFRIEPGEIETALKADVSVRGAVVVARTDAAGVPKLAAYVVPAAADTFDPEETRARLRRTLPAFMVPTHLIVMDAFPLTPNGKVDQRALPEPDWATSARPDYVAPATPLERELADIWSRVLQVERVGIHDDFFALGGDSILTIRVSTMAGERAIDLSPTKLFESPTIAALVLRGDVGMRPAGQQVDAVAAAADIVATGLNRREIDVLTKVLGKRQ
jgi:amino acid adenylation domain-containing protein